MALITLTTDYGTSDHYAGALKGVIASIAPTARVVDITHDVGAFDLSEAAFTVAQTYPCFPKKTIHVVVVDPGVGTSRRAILIEAAGQIFIGPDNGVFSMVLAAEPKARVRAVTNGKLFRKPVSATFHGRDIFAPVAAHLAKGATPAKVGKVIEDYLRARTVSPDRTARRGWTGQVIKVDRFGNLITNFKAAEFPHVLTQRFEMAIGLQPVAKLAANYEECGFGEPFLIVGSSGYIEVSVNQGSAAKALGCGVGAPVELTIF